jgi:hypothetical protein
MTRNYVEKRSSWKIYFSAIRQNIIENGVYSEIQRRKVVMVTDY